MLRILNLSKAFGGLIALNDVSFHVQHGEILGLIGPNGAGKSTLFNVICGVYRPTTGKVIFDGEDITGLRPYQVAQRGIIRTFQETTIFKDFTVMENMQVAFHLPEKIGTFETFFAHGATHRKEKVIEKKATEVLEFVGMEHLKDEIAQNLSHGYQKTLVIALALASNPRLLMLDEPVTALNPERVYVIMALIKKISERGITVILIEHNIRAIMGVCDKIVVLNFGKKLIEGRPEEVRNNRNVIEAYLGANTYNGNA